MKNNDDILEIISSLKEQISQCILYKLKEKGLEGLVPTHGEILMSLNKSPLSKMNELASTIRRKKNTVTTLIQKLEELKYVETLPSINDSRVTLVKITQEGERVGQDFKKIYEEVANELWGKISEKKKTKLADRLNTLLANLEKVNS